MNIPGHLASAYFLARRDVPLAAVALGALLPDLIDKPMLWGGLTPYGRTVGHGLLFWGAALALWLLSSRRPGTSAALLVGGFSHLLADLADDLVEGLERTGHVFSAWMGWPVTTPDMVNVQVPHLLEPMRHATTTLELATVAACLWHARFRRY